MPTANANPKLSGAWLCPAWLCEWEWSWWWAMVSVAIVAGPLGSTACDYNAGEMANTITAAASPVLVALGDVPRSIMVRSALGSALRCPARVSNHLAHCLPPSFETPREARAAPQDE